MSIDNLLFLYSNRLPSLKEWQVALDAENIEIIIEDVGDLREYSGYLPVIYKGEPSGFEWYFMTAEEMFPDETPDWLGGRTHAVDLRTFSDMREFYCAMVAGALLGRLANAVAWDDAAQNAVSPETWLQEAEQAKSHRK